MSEVTVDEIVLKKTFWRNIIEIRHPATGTVVAHRFVACVTNWDEGSRGETDAEYEIFVPQHWDDPYNLVLSLATNGASYPTYDLDDPRQLNPAMGAGLIITPSTSNYHAWGMFPETWSNVIDQTVPGGIFENEGYWTMNRTQGWCGLRPPWEQKDYSGSRYLSTANYYNYRWGPVGDEPPGVTLEDLFGEE